MPSKSWAQHRLMTAVEHDPAFAKKVGIPVSVGKDFAKDDNRAGITEHPDSKATTRAKLHGDHVRNSSRNT